MLLEPAERDTSIENQERIISTFLNSESQVMFVVENVNDSIIGCIVGVGGKFNRNRHSLNCIVGVQLVHQGQGLATKLFNELESWAKSKGFHRMELTVMDHNQKAISLYKKLCFQIEGVKLHSLKVSGKYVNELSMSKLLNA